SGSAFPVSATSATPASRRRWARSRTSSRRGWPAPEALRRARASGRENMRLTVADAISPSYFVAIAALPLGVFQREGVDVEFVFSPPNPSRALKDGTIDFFGGSPYTGLRTFPGWRGGVLLCALSHYTYWFLAVRADIPGEQGDVGAVKGLRLSASAEP